ncbi:MAG TPA: hypothetical protein VIM93_01020 [Kangiella sp.]
MNTKTLAIISILMLSSLLSACSDDSSKESSNPQSEAQNDDEVGVLEPYLEEPVLETHKNGERKIGLYSESNGQGTFKDCKTGKEYTIDINQYDGLLHSTYLALTQDDEQILMVELVGEIQTDKDELSRLHPQKLLGIIHLTSCP